MYASLYWSFVAVIDCMQEPRRFVTRVDDAEFRDGIEIDHKREDPA